MISFIYHMIVKNCSLEKVFKKLELCMHNMEFHIILDL